MQKNIVLGVNAALAAEAKPREKNPTSEHFNTTFTEEFNAMRLEIENLKKENSEVSQRVEEMKAESETLKAKIDELLSSPSKTKQKSKKKKK